MLKADFESHHIEGMAIHGDTPFSVDLISHVEGNLWTGGCIGGVSLGDDFRYVVSVYPWEKYEIGPGTERFETELYDSSTIPDADRLYALARRVNRYRAEGKTLVHCQAGLNRSALVAGLALVLAGRTGAEAIALMREKRSEAVLCNSTFENWLRLRSAPC